MHARVIGAISAAAAAVLQLVAGFLPYVTAEFSDMEFSQFDFSRGTAVNVLASNLGLFASVGLLASVSWLAFARRHLGVIAGIALGIGIAGTLGVLGTVIAGPGEDFDTGAGTYVRLVSDGLALAAGILILLEARSRVEPVGDPDGS